MCTICMFHSQSCYLYTFYMQFTFLFSLKQNKRQTILVEQSCGSPSEVTSMHPTSDYKKLLSFYAYILQVKICQIFSNCGSYQAQCITKHIILQIWKIDNDQLFQQGAQTLCLQNYAFTYSESCQLAHCSKTTPFTIQFHHNFIAAHA